LDGGEETYKTMRKRTNELGNEGEILKQIMGEYRIETYLAKLYLVKTWKGSR
jgi:hypothetical protein